LLFVILYTIFIGRCQPQTLEKTKKKPKFRNSFDSKGLRKMGAAPNFGICQPQNRRFVKKEMGNSLEPANAAASEQ